MSYRLQDVVHENGRHWVLRVPKGFEVYRVEATASVRCAQIGAGAGPNLGIERAIAECARREAPAFQEATAARRAQMASYYLKVVEWARRRYTVAGLLPIQRGAEPLPYTRIERAAWARYMEA